LVDFTNIITLLYAIDFFHQKYYNQGVTNSRLGMVSIC
jgi:hypothetical protein